MSLTQVLGRCQPLPDTGFDPWASFADMNARIMIVSSPKAGATLSARLMLSSLNLTQVAMKYTGHWGYPFGYARNVFPVNKQARRVAGLMEEGGCSAADALCLAIVRNPIDRAISSYIMIMRVEDFRADFAELGGRYNASFEEFVRALDRRAAGGNWSNSHAMPQHNVLGSQRAGLQPGVLYVPIEMLSEPNAYRCPQLKRLQGWRLADQEGEGVMRHHYVQQAAPTVLTTDSEHQPWSYLMKQQKLPSYDSFWGSQSFCQHVIGCLYKRDLELYVQTCTLQANKFLGCTAFYQACQTQLTRLRRVCGVLTDNRLP